MPEKPVRVDEPASEHWLRLYPGTQKYQVPIQWISAFGGLSSIKNGQQNARGKGEDSLDLISLNTKFPNAHRLQGDSSNSDPLSKFLDGEELAWEVGSQLCGLISEHEKGLLSNGTLNQSPYRLEYFKGK